MIFTSSLPVKDEHLEDSGLTIYKGYISLYYEYHGFRCEHCNDKWSSQGWLDRHKITSKCGKPIDELKERLLKQFQAIGM